MVLFLKIQLLDIFLHQPNVKDSGQAYHNNPKYLDREA